MSEPLPRAARAAHQSALWPLAAAAPLPLPWTGVIGFPALIFYEISILLFFIQARRGRPIWVSNLILNLAALLYAAGFLLEIRTLRHGLVKVATHLLLFTAAAKFASLKTFREEQTALLLCFFLALDSAASSTHVLSILYLAVLAVVAFRCLARIAVLADFGEVVPPRILSGLPSAGISILGVAAIGALSVPLFVSLPRLNSPFATPAIPKEAFEGSFFTSDRVDLSSFPAAKRSDRILLRVVGHSVALPETLRLREATFNRYVNGQWSRQGLAAVRLSATAENRVDIPAEYSTAAPLPGPRRPASLEIDASSLTYGFLFVPYGAYSVVSAKPISVSQDAALSYPGALGGERYSVQYVPQVDGSGPGRAGLALHDVPDEIAALSRRLAAGAVGHRQVAERLVEYLKHGFVYRIDPPKPEGDPVVDFLIRSRQGHCEYFASALALMMRSEGIPARLATGSLGGEVGPFSSELIVRGSNLHAWVEADVDGTGFRVFDPTPPEGLPKFSRISFWGKLAQLGTEAEFFYDRNILGFSTLEQVSLLEGARDLFLQVKTLFRSAPVLSGQIPLAFATWLAVALLAILWLTRLRPGRRRPPGARAYLRLRRLYARRVAPLSAATNSAEVIRGFAAKGRQAGVSARKIVEIYRGESFGEKEVTPDSRRELRREWTRLRKALAAGAVVLAALLGAPRARGESPPPPKAPDASRVEELKVIQARLEESKKRLASFEQKTASLKEEIEALNLRLEIAGREREVIAARQAELSRQNEDLTVRLNQARADRDRSLHGLRSRMLLLSRLGRFGYLQLLLSARGTGDMFLALKSLDAMARTDAEALSRLNRTSLVLEQDLAAQTELAEEAGKLLAADREQENRIAILKQERVRLLSQSQNETIVTRREVTELSGKAQKLENLLDLLSRGEPARGSPRPWKGVLDWPARGKIAVTFGRHRHPKFDAWTVSNGIEIVADDGSPVSAVFAGKVVFARWFADYGNMVVLDHGDEVLSLYARLRAIHVHVGDIVSAGDRVGLVGIGPGETEPSLYFEIRDRQKAADPLSWLR